MMMNAHIQSAVGNPFRRGQRRRPGGLRDTRATAKPHHTVRGSGPGLGRRQPRLRLGRWSRPWCTSHNAHPHDERVDGMNCSPSPGRRPKSRALAVMPIHTRVAGRGPSAERGRVLGGPAIGIVRRDPSNRVGQHSPEPGVGVSGRPVPGLQIGNWTPPGRLHPPTSQCRTAWPRRGSRPGRRKRRVPRRTRYALRTRTSCAWDGRLLRGRWRPRRTPEPSQIFHPQ